MTAIPMRAVKAKEAALSALSTSEGSEVVARILNGRSKSARATRDIARAYWSTHAALPAWNSRGDYDKRPYEALNSQRDALHKMIESLMTNDEISTCRTSYIADAIRSYWSFQSPHK